MKSDARVRYTKHIIQEVFLELLKEKPLSKITVKEICERSEINRGTFYKHYQDVYDLMEQLEKEALDRFEELLSQGVENAANPTLRILLSSLQENRHLIVPFMDNSTNNDFLKRLTERCTGYAMSHLDAALLQEDARTQYKYAYLGGGTSMLIEQWLRNDTKESPQEIADMIMDLNNSTLTVK